MTHLADVTDNCMASTSVGYVFFLRRCALLRMSVCLCASVHLRVCVYKCVATGCSSLWAVGMKGSTERPSTPVNAWSFKDMLYGVALLSLGFARQLVWPIRTVLGSRSF